MQNSKHRFFSPLDNSDYIITTNRPLSLKHSRNSFLYIAKQLGNKNLGKSLKKFRDCFVSFEKIKLVLLSQKFNDIEAEKAAGFLVSLSHISIFSESLEEVFIYKQIT